MANTVTVTAFGSNYEGALYRGILSQTDERTFKIVLTGTESDVCQYLLDNCGYGTDELREHTLDGLIKQLKDKTITQFEGCGGILELIQSNKKLFKVRGWTKTNAAPTPIIDLGELTLTGTDSVPSINKQIKQQYATNPEQFPVREPNTWYS